VEEQAVLAPQDEAVRVAGGLTLRIREHRRPDRPVGPSPAPDLLLVHGLSSNARLWDGVGARLAAAGHRAVAVDLRGHGRSEGSDDLAFPTLVDDLARVIDATGLQRPVVVGQSWGGNVVLELGAARPELVSGVVGVDGGLIDLSRRFPDIDACWGALAPPAFDHLVWDRLAEGMRARLIGWPDGAAEAQLGNLVAEPDGRVRAILTRERHRSIVEHLFHHRPIERLRALEAPMLLLAVTGGPRSVVDEDVLAEARAAATRLDLVRLPGRDHDVHLQDPDLVAGLLHDWASGRPVPEER
jgi:pimeloyl-ACP methyl ester carboxylesterase